MLEDVLSKLSRKTVDEIYSDVGEGMLGRQLVTEAVLASKKQDNKGTLLFSLSKPFRKKKSSVTNPMPITGLIPGMALHFAKCCHPIPGDRIVGIVTTGKGITVHTMNAKRLRIIPMRRSAG